MKWKKYIENQYIQGRIPQEWKVKIIYTAETAIEEYKKEIIKEIQILIGELELKKYTLNNKNIDSYFTRLDTLEEIIKLIIK
jgi:hypothetical protein